MPKLTFKAELKKLHSPDVIDLERFSPDGPFCIFVQAMVGPLGVDAEESFDLSVCTAEWFGENISEEIVSGRQYLFVKNFNYHAIKRYIAEFCFSCQGETWEIVANKLSRLGHWEFEDYRPRIK